MTLIVIGVYLFRFDWQWLIFVVIYGIVGYFRIKCGKVEWKLWVIGHWFAGKAFRLTKFSILKNCIGWRRKFTINDFLSQLSIVNPDWVSHDVIFSFWAILTENAAKSFLFQAIFLNVSIDCNCIGVDSTTIRTLRSIVCWHWIWTVVLTTLIVVHLRCTGGLSINWNIFWVQNLAKYLEWVTICGEKNRNLLKKIQSISKVLTIIKYIKCCC